MNEASEKTRRFSFSTSEAMCDDECCWRAQTRASKVTSDDERGDGAVERWSADVGSRIFNVLFLFGHCSSTTNDAETNDRFECCHNCTTFCSEETEQHQEYPTMAKGSHGRIAAVLFLVIHVACLHTGQAFTALVSLRPGNDRRMSTRTRSQLDHVALKYITEDGTELAETTVTAIVTPDSEASSRFTSESYVLMQAGLIGILSGCTVGGFKVAIDTMRHVCYGASFSSAILPLIPALGGVVVGILSMPSPFPSGLRGTVEQVDKNSKRVAYGLPKYPNDPLGYLRKTAAAIFTLGSGSSLGPEGPAVEIGMGMSRFCMNVLPPFELAENKGDNTTTIRTFAEDIVHRNRLLLSCGAAAGVSAGFNAPIAGVFFALEIVQGAFASAAQSDDSGRTLEPETPTQTTGDITAILVASVLSALVSHSILGEHMVLKLSEYTLQTPLTELPMYLLLGGTCGVVAFLFTQTAKAAKAFFEGDVGSQEIRDVMKSIPNSAKPVIGGLLCGLIGLVFPQVLFFGYGTLNTLLTNSSLPTMVLLSLLVVKTAATALAAGSGLVGGTFAPALFLGAMAGASFHNIMASLIQFAMDTDMPFLHDVAMQLTDVPAYTMIGAASVLAALFRAPLTASMLLFELTREYDVILPLMVSAGVGSIIGDILEEKVEREQVIELRRDRDTVSWGDLSFRSVKDSLRETQEVLPQPKGRDGT